MLATMSTMRVAGLIPARGGSKSVPRKNLAEIGGRSLLARAIDSARASRRLTSVSVDTDDPEIAAAAHAAGAEVLPLRPADLSGDAAAMVDVALRAVELLDWPDALVLLQPTSPFRTAEQIDDAIALLEASGAPAVVSVAPVEHHPYWMHRIDAGRLVPLYPEGAAVQRRQDLPPVVRETGAIVAIRGAILRTQRTLLPAGVAPLVTDATSGFDIDTQDDLDRARALADRGRH
jgi:CMP-N,N'-diacetyllegionaminic acid synthase